MSGDETREERKRRLANARQTRCRAKKLQRDEIADVLLEIGELKEWDADDPARIAEAIAAHFRRLREGLG